MPPIGLSDLIDILIVAFFVYKLLALIRGTRATAIIKGLAFIFVANAFSRFAGLDTVTWILDRGMTVILVALPVVFYPELRRGLERLGRGPLLPREGFGREDVVRSIEALVKCSVSLSRAGVGGLTVIERETPLGEYAESGVRIDALVSPELLINIFSPKSPLHDGAVIVRGGRIVAAACVLPLSEEPGRTGGLGTRHRAGLGVTEESDALAIVISEETGRISLARAGELRRGLDEATLRQELRHHLLEAAPLAAFRGGR